MVHGDFIVGLPGETRDTLRNTIDFAKRLDVRDHPGFDRARVSGHGVLRLRARKTTWCRSTCRTTRATSCRTWSIPGILKSDEMVDWVERFYGEYYFRPKAAWRIVRKAIFDNHDRSRLYKEAKSLSVPAPQAPEVCRRKQGRRIDRARSGRARR